MGGPSLPGLPQISGGNLPGPAAFRSPIAQQLFQGFLNLGQTPGQAFDSTVAALSQGTPDVGAAHEGTHLSSPNQAPGLAPDDTVADTKTVAQTFDSLPAEQQNSVVRDSSSISAPVRNALDQIGITHGRNDAPPATTQSASAREASTASQALNNNAPQQVLAPNGREAASFARAETVATANTVAQTLGTTNAQSQGAIAQANAGFVVRDGSPQFAAFANGQQAGGQRTEPGARDAVLLQQPASRAPEGQVAGRSGADFANVVAMADRASQAQTQAQNLPAFAQGRAESVPNQAMATLAGAAMLANPQGNPMLAQAPNVAHVPPGTDAAAAQAREAHLAPAGHTVAGSFRRDLRTGATPQAERRGESLLSALIPGRKRNAADDEEQSTSFQWLFWILTIAAYGSLGVAILAMIPSGGSLTDGFGQPSVAGYALIAGAVAAIAAWLMGRKLAKNLVDPTPE